MAIAASAVWLAHGASDAAAYPAIFACLHEDAGAAAHQAAHMHELYHDLAVRRGRPESIPEQARDP